MRATQCPVSADAQHALSAGPSPRFGAEFTVPVDPSPRFAAASVLCGVSSSTKKRGAADTDMAVLDLRTDAAEPAKKLARRCDDGTVSAPT